MDLQSRVRREDYIRVKEEMFERTSTSEAPWYIAEGNEKIAARSISCITCCNRFPTRKCCRKRSPCLNAPLIPNMSTRHCRDELYAA
jgi:hypothetical protein